MGSLKELLIDAISKYRKPEIVNSDEDTQYTRELWTQYLETQGIKISMDGNGRALDNIWIERFWKNPSSLYFHMPIDPFLLR